MLHFVSYDKGNNVSAFAGAACAAGMTVVGTTDNPSDITMEPRPEEDDVRFILEEANRYLNRKASRSLYSSQRY